MAKNTKYKCSYTELVPIHKLVPNPENPNMHPESQINLLAEIIDFQGQRSPVVVSKQSGFIVKGHGRLMAIEKLGWKEVAVDYQDYDTPAQEYADLVADNKIAELSQTNMALVLDKASKLDLPKLDLLGVPDLKLPTAEDTGFPDLPSGEKSKLEQITFTLSKDQAEEVRAAIAKAHGMGDYDSENENKNGNAIARICETFLTYEHS
jgi:hypothetical protein